MSGLFVFFRHQGREVLYERNQNISGVSSRLGQRSSIEELRPTLFSDHRRRCAWNDTGTGLGARKRSLEIENSLERGAIGEQAVDG